MSTSDEASNVVVTSGDLLKSRQQTLVNTVNTVGVMGKGIALAFKKRYPEMFADYAARCSRGEVRLGEPYPVKADDHLIVNFPTKGHWRAVSRLADIVAGLEYLEKHYLEWGVTSIAVPPLGCGNGQLEWEVVAPTLIRHLSRLEIPVELFAPVGALTDQSQLLLLAEDPQESKIPAEWVAVVAVLDRLQRLPHHWPVGRVLFQKIAYFAGVAGIETGLKFERGSYGPFSADLKRKVAQLQNNGLVQEVKRGQMIEVRVGPTYADAVNQVRDRMEPYRAAVERTVDLMARMNTASAEVAATVHFAAADATMQTGGSPSMRLVVDIVNSWKPGRIQLPDLVDAVALLCMRGWSDVSIDEEAARLVETRLAV